MPEEAKDEKAKKLAAARKKLKEYQSRAVADSTATTAYAADVATREASIKTSAVQEQSTAGSVSSNLSERSDSELNFNGNVTAVGIESGGGGSAVNTPPPVVMIETATVTKTTDATPTTAPLMSTAASYFSALPPPTPTAATMFTAAAPVAANVEQPFNLETSQQNLNAMQVLIVEQAQLSADLNKHRTACREKDLELEELRTQYSNTVQHLEDLQQRFLVQQQSSEQLRHTNAELQHNLSHAAVTSKDQVAHLQELKQQLNGVKSSTAKLEEQLKEKGNELELAQIRIRQLSDESNISKDDRVETLTQTKFMYEQQIRDLQAMVQQLSQDKEQANMQYQNYVQHLNTELTNLNERNNDFTDECTKLQERERQLVEHISGLEREIQRNISRQDQLKDREQKNQGPTLIETPETAARLTMLEEKISEFELERHEFQLKIKSQEDNLQQLRLELGQKCSELDLTQERLANVSEGRLDTTKLLATMESDKVAASRALSQNVELKKQLDELELRFVQLTNDKADLMNKLDAEEYANRETRANYAIMEERLHSQDERFKFKDEEMIRLSHENMELKRRILMQQQQIDRLQHYEVNRYDEAYKEDDYEQPHNEHENAHVEHDRSHNDHEHFHNDHDHSHDNHDNVHDYHDHVHNDHNHEHPNHGHPNHEHHHDAHYRNHTPNIPDRTEKTHVIEIDACQEANEATDKTKLATGTHSQHSIAQQHHSLNTSTPHIPTTEAVEKLQQRFTQLMSQVAELTDEKQRLEHLVLQLQSETETIGEYIALYQTQRRMLKQREYEKAAQMQLLQAEREQMREKIAILNNLVRSLGVELPPNTHGTQVSTVDLDASRSMQEHLSAALTPDNEMYSRNILKETSDDQQTQQQHLCNAGLGAPLHSIDTQQILTKIQDIISEIKENTKDVPTVPTVDHLNCCLGKFEVV